MKHFANFYSFSDGVDRTKGDIAPAESLRLRGGRKIEYDGNSYSIGKARLSTRKGKKYEVDVTNNTNGTTKTVHWGSQGYDDYYIHKDKDRRDRFRKRMSAITTKDGKIASDDPTRSSYHALRHNW
jgi:hypothetical protein